MSVHVANRVQGEVVGKPDGSDACTVLGLKQGGRDSNPRPPVLETGALPN